MTQIAFVPNTQGTFQFQPTLDGNVYTCFIYWNLFGQRYYILCLTQAGQEVFNLALSGSPLDYDLNIAAGYFTTSTLIYRDPTQVFEVTP